MLPDPSLLVRLDAVRPEARQYGESFTARAETLKKRPEIVVATDHIGIETYDVRTSQIISSHSVPPGETFTCPPVSVFVKGKRNSSDFERFTYWIATGGSVASSRRSAGARLSCLHETASGSQVINSTSLDDRNLTQPASFLQICRASTKQDSSSHSVVVISDDGLVTCLSGNLDKIQWSSQLCSKGSPLKSSMRREACVIDIEHARSVLFKSRGDILASLPNHDLQDDFNTSVLAVIEAREPSSALLHYFMLNSKLDELMSVSIPRIEESDATKSEWQMHSKSGKVFQIVYGDATSLAVTDITELVPVVKHSLRLQDVSSILRLSSSSVAVISGNTVNIINTKWSSLVDECPITTVAAPDALRKARLISYYPSTGVLTMATNNSIFAISTTDVSQDNGPPKKKRRTNTLADAFARGIGAGISTRSTANSSAKKAIGKRIIPAASAPETDKTIKDLDALLHDNDPTEFDPTLFALLKDLFNDSGKHGFQSIHLTQPILIEYAIRCLFSLKNLSSSADDELSLTVKTMAPETFRFLLNRGLLSTSYVEGAMQAGIESVSRRKLSSSAIVEALVSHDPSLQALIYYLSSAPILPANELVVALHYSLQGAERAERMENHKLTHEKEYRAGGISRSGLTEVSGAIGAADSGENTSHAGFEGDWPDPDPREGAKHNAQSALRSCLGRLSFCSDKDIRGALKSLMQPSELLTLIDYVRTELAGGGWLARTVGEELEGEDDLSSQTSQINIMAKILNCAIDSLGAVAWLLGTNEDVEASKSAEKIAYMRAEINAALGGIEDSASLETMLQEVLLFAKTCKATASGTEGQADLMTSGDTVILHTAEEERQESILPMGLKRKGEIPKTKIVKGKEVPRSKRNKAWLANKKVPEYSFERIFI